MSGLELGLGVRGLGGLVRVRVMSWECIMSMKVSRTALSIKVVCVRVCGYYQDVTSIVSGLSGQANSQPLIIAVCFTRLSTVPYICTSTPKQIHLQ